MQETISSAKSGCQVSISKLIVASERYVRAVVKSLIGTKFQSQVDVDDITQECLVQIATDVANCQATDWSGFKGWIAVVARNRTYKVVTAIKAQKRGSGNVCALAEEFDPSGSVGTPDAIAESREAIETIFQHAQDLGSDTATMIKMVSEGYSRQEIADALQIPIFGLDSKLKRFRAACRELVS